MDSKLKILIVVSSIIILPLSAQYSFDFINTTDTVVISTDSMKFFFRLENTGTEPDTYRLDCRWVSDSIPGWDEMFCAGGMCTWPGIPIMDYLDAGEVDSAIDIVVYPTADSGMEVLNLHVQSIFEPSLMDSISVYAVYGAPGLYNFDFACLGDTEVTDTTTVEFQFRIENTGTSPDTYAFDLRVIDSVPGWTEEFFVDGEWAEPGTILTEYLGVWSVDTAIYVRVEPIVPPGIAVELLNFHVQSLTNPDVKDSIFLHVIISAIEEHPGMTIITPMLLINPNPFKNKTEISFSPGHRAEGIELEIYNSIGQLVKSYSLSTAYSLEPTVVSWDGNDEKGLRLPAGVYFVRFVAKDIILTDKAILLR